MRTTTNSVPNTQYSNQGYAPSVPLSVYRDLAAELQAAQSVVDSLSAKNHLLSQENRLLRQEIAKAVNSVMQLQQLLSTQSTAQSTTSYNSQPLPTANVKTAHHPPSAQPRQTPKPQPRKPRAAPQKKIKIDRAPQSEPTPEYFPMSEPIYIEEQEVHYYPYSNTQKAETNGWMLLIAILLIVLTAFGAGYLVVRPLLANHNNSD